MYQSNKFFLKEYRTTTQSTWFS